ncbi:MAG: Panacea domain-containing protein [Alphaproteobacteria bacterium]|nr:Panacea domain-containing protein [Alphaproteobacteria bacterium]
MEQFNRQKFKDVIHYVVAKTRPDELGRVKLHKVLYFTDMIWFIAEGRGLTGVEYRKQPMGPVATDLGLALGELEDEGRIRIGKTRYFGYDKASYEALLLAPEDRLGEIERQLIDDVIEFVCRNNTARSISDFSHTRVWEAAENGAVMPYFTALNMLPVEIEDAAINWAREEAAKLVTARSGDAAVQRRDYRAFREGLRSHRG